MFREVEGTTHGVHGCKLGRPKTLKGKRNLLVERRVSPMPEESEKDFRHLVRISGVDIRGEKNVVFGLSLIKGIGPRTARIVCEKAGVDWRKRIGYLTEREVEAIEGEIKSLENAPPWLLNRQKDYSTGGNMQLIGSELLLVLREDLNRLKKIRCYRGIRHELGLPVRGQRTRSTFRKGATVGVTRKKSRQAQQK